MKEKKGCKYIPVPERHKLYMLTDAVLDVKEIVYLGNHLLRTVSVIKTDMFY